MVSVEDRALRGGGARLKQAIWDAARETLSAWTGQELTQCSLYGVRVYPKGSVLATHVDRLPLVTSAILNVAQDVDEPWYVCGQHTRIYIYIYMYMCERFCVCVFVCVYTCFCV